MFIKAERAETRRLEKGPLILEVVNLMQCLALSLLGAWSSEGLGSCWAQPASWERSGDGGCTAGHGTSTVTPTPVYLLLLGGTSDTRKHHLDGRWC